MFNFLCSNKKNNKCVFIKHMPINKLDDIFYHRVNFDIIKIISIENPLDIIKIRFNRINIFSFDLHKISKCSNLES
jgi:hypothetical protein